MNKHVLLRTLAIIAVLAVALFLVTARQKKIHEAGVMAPAVVP